MRRLPRQPLVNHAMHSWDEYQPVNQRLLSRLRPRSGIAGDNRAATAREEPVFRGVKWKPAGSLPGRAARRGSTLSPCPCVCADEAADEHLRIVDLHRERVVVHRRVRGMRMALNLPVAAFRGVVIRLTHKRRRSDGDRRRARARRSGAVAAALRIERTRRHRRRMAGVGPRARVAAARRRA